MLYILTFLLRKKAEKRKKTDTKFSKKNVFLSLLQNPGQGFYSQKKPGFHFFRVIWE